MSNVQLSVTSNKSALDEKCMVDRGGIGIVSLDRRMRGHERRRRRLTAFVAPTLIQASDADAVKAATNTETVVEGVIESAEWSSTGKVMNAKFEGSDLRRRVQRNQGSARQGIQR